MRPDAPALVYAERRARRLVSRVVLNATRRRVPNASHRLYNHHHQQGEMPAVEYELQAADPTNMRSLDGRRETGDAR